MVEISPVLVGILVALVVFFFFVFLFLRRVSTGFREGFERGRGGE